MSCCVTCFSLDAYPILVSSRDVLPDVRVTPRDRQSAEEFSNAQADNKNFPDTHTHKCLVTSENWFLWCDRIKSIRVYMHSAILVLICDFLLNVVIKESKVPTWYLNNCKTPSSNTFIYLVITIATLHKHLNFVVVVITFYQLWTKLKIIVQRVILFTFLLLTNTWFIAL